MTEQETFPAYLTFDPLKNIDGITPRLQCVAIGDFDAIYWFSHWEPSSEVPRKFYSVYKLHSVSRSRLYSVEAKPGKNAPENQTEIRNDFCKNCKFWARTSALAGECRRHTPLNHVGNVAYHLWPSTSPDNWCGEFQSNSPNLWSVNASLQS